MTREDERWWWNCQIQRNAKLAKCEIVPLNKKLQLYMSIVFDPRWFWHGGLYQSCSPWCALGWGAKNWESLVWKTWNARAQISDQNINGRFDHYHMWSQFEFEFDLICVSLIPKVVISV